MIQKQNKSLGKCEMQKLTNKQLQRKRMMMYFVEAAKDLIDHEGMASLSIRKVAEKAGYNSATLYHYFSNLRHLIYFSCIHYLKEYVADLPRYLANSQSPLDQFFKYWECFCKHAYNKPDIYNLLFFENLEGETFDRSFKSYYDVFPEELTEDAQEYYDMMMEYDIYLKEFMSLKKTCQKLNSPLDDPTLKQLAEMNVLIFRGMLASLKNGNHEYSVDDAVNRTLFYINQACHSFGLTNL